MTAGPAPDGTARPALDRAEGRVLSWGDGPVPNQAESSVTNRAESPVRLVGLLGWPVEHSVSPAMHKAAFAALSLDWSSSLLPTPPGEVGRALADLKSGGFRGANVTVPHKQAVLPYLDQVTGDARAIGAVNTIQVQGEDKIK